MPTEATVPADTSTFSFDAQQSLPPLFPFGATFSFQNDALEKFRPFFVAMVIFLSVVNIVIFFSSFG